LRIMEFFRALYALLNYKTWGPFTDAASESRFDYSFTISWSQGAEDLALASIFQNKPIGKYIDVGAHHPSRFSVTRKLYQGGWSGINVEANPKLLREFEKFRPRDLNLNFVVGQLESYSLAVFEEPALSTVNTEWKRKFLSEKNSLKETINVPGITLRNIQDTYGDGVPFDLLTIDAEGSDLDVLMSFNFENSDRKIYPKVIMIETEPGVENILSTPMASLLYKYGYELWFALPMSSVFRFRHE
jgi:FkbM family methyltransferase